MLRRLIIDNLRLKQSTNANELGNEMYKTAVEGHFKCTSWHKAKEETMFDEISDVMHPVNFVG